VRRRRFEQVVLAAAHLMRQGEVVFCPISHSHDIGIVLGEESSFEMWMDQDLPILRACSNVKVLRLDGWEQSRGVGREVDEAMSIHIPITFIDFDPSWWGL